MRILVILFLILTILKVPTVWAEEINAGFVQGIWYGNKTLFANTPARIYVALRNNSDTDLTGTIRFSDNSIRLGTTQVSALPGRIVEAWVDWTPTYGTHTITATLVDVRAHAVGENAEAVEVESTIAEDTIAIDYDTDGDEIGNDIDTDDDADGLPDIDEVVNKTNPLVSDQNETNTPQSDTPTILQKETAEATPVTGEVSVPTQTLEGLEQYTDTGTVDTLMSNVTAKIVDAKSTLDMYRDTRTRTKDISNTMPNTGNLLTTPILETGSTSIPISSIATITRSRIPENETGFLERTLAAGDTLLGGVYTFLLWVLSNALSQPAVLEVLLLVSILYVVYRTARRLAKRPNFRN